MVSTHLPTVLSQGLKYVICFHMYVEEKWFIKSKISMNAITTNSKTNQWALSALLSPRWESRVLQIPPSSHFRPDMVGGEWDSPSAQCRGAVGLGKGTRGMSPGDIRNMGTALENEIRVCVGGIHNPHLSSQACMAQTMLTYTVASKESRRSHLDLTRARQCPGQRSLYSGMLGRLLSNH